MGTRNLTMMVKNGKYVVAQYGQWDGYPEGQGITILNALKKYRKEWLAKQLDHVTEYNADDARRYYLEAGADFGLVDDYVNENKHAPEIVVSTIFENHPELSRDTGGMIIHMVADAEGKLPLRNDTEFAGSFSCEWAYVIDFDKNVLEVYTICRERLEPSDRFYFLYDVYKEKGEEKYCRPVKMIKSYSLDSLPDDDVFVSELNNIVNG